MWKAWTILIIIILVAAGAGYGIAQYMGSKDSQVVDEQEEPAQVEVVTEPEPTPTTTTQPAITEVAEEETVAPTENADLKKIIDLYDSSVNGFLYYYLDDKYYVKNNKIKIELEHTRDASAGLFNTVYLDTKTREAVAFCEDLDDVSGRKCDGKKNQAIQVEYNSFYTLTPADWMDRIRVAQNPEVTLKARTLFNRRVDEITWGTGAGETTVFVDHTFGAPVEAIQGTQKWDYLQLGINQVAAIDVTRPDA